MLFHNHMLFMFSMNTLQVEMFKELLRIVMQLSTYSNSL